MVDTSLYPPAYQQQLLTLLTEEIDLDEHTDGVLIHSDNFQALNLLQARYREQVKCIYIDPPYNTGNDGFIYKDNYQHSSWLTTMENRLQAAYPLLCQDGVNFISIDDTENSRLRLVYNEYFDSKNFKPIVWKKKSGSGNTEKLLAVITENIHCYFVKSESGLFSYRDIDREYKYKDDIGVYNVEGIEKTNLGAYERPTMLFGVENPETGEIFYPSKDMRWTIGKIKFEQYIKEGRIIFNSKDKKVKLIKRPEHYEQSENVHYNLLENLGSLSTAKDLLSNLGFPREYFDTPKPIKLIEHLINLVFDKYKSALILDYFAGSGTTAHAVINLNREDGGNRKYILVEQGEYFDTVLKPRVQKVIYSENWKDGKPMPSEKASDGFNGVSQIVKVLKLESYEDTLNNLELKGQADFIGGLPESVQEDYLLRYLLDVESKGSLLNSDDFTHPFDYCLNIATDSAGAYTKTNIDLVETFNYLLGLRVQHITDEREKRGYVMVEGALPNGDRSLIVWRDVEKMGYAEVAQCFNAQNINPNSDQYDVVYLNGDHDMASLWQNEDGTESRLSLRAIEPEFLRLMFAQKGE